MPEPRSSEQPITLGTTQARAGETSGRVRTVLLTSLSGAIVALAVAYALWVLVR